MPRPRAAGRRSPHTIHRKAVAKNDEAIERRIEALEDERARLRADEGTHAGHSEDAGLGADRRRLAEIQVELDQLWDLLRRRRATARVGNDPDAEQLRDAGTVENYLG